MHRFLSVLLLMLSCSASIAQTGVTPDQFIRGLLSDSKARCSKRGELPKEFEKQGRKAEAFSAEGAERMLCDCIPSRAKALSASLSATERSKVISESIFVTTYLPKIVDKCSSDQFKSTYGEGCSERFAKTKRNSEKYCSCMSSRISEFSDAEATKIGQESSSYIPQLAEAKKRGLPPPEQPALLKRFLSSENACSTEQ